MNKLIILLVLFLFGSTATVSAQSFHNYNLDRELSVSLGGGTSTYFGDLKDPKEVIDARANINVGMQYSFHPQISGRAEVSWFRLSGDDSESELAGKTTRNLSFRSDNLELDLVAVGHLYPKGRRFYQRPQFNPYGFAGIGFLYFNPKGEIPGTDWDGNPLPGAGTFTPLQPLNTEGNDYSRLGIVIPFGLGVKFKVNPFFDVSIEGGYRLTFTDYLDDVSTVFRDHNSFGESKLAQAMADRRHELDLPPVNAGNIRGYAEQNDGYYLLSLKVEYYLAVGSGAPNMYKRKRRSPKRMRRR